MYTQGMRRENAGVFLFVMATIFTHEDGHNMEDVHLFLRSLAEDAQEYTLQYGVHYVVKGRAMYGIDFSYPLWANPVCQRNADHAGYALVAPNGKTFCF